MLGLAPLCMPWWLCVALRCVDLLRFALLHSALRGAVLHLVGVVTVGPPKEYSLTDQTRDKRDAACLKMDSNSIKVTFCCCCSCFYLHAPRSLHYQRHPPFPFPFPSKPSPFFFFFPSSLTLRHVQYARPPRPSLHLHLHPYLSGLLCLPCLTARRLLPSHGHPQRLDPAERDLAFRCSPPPDQTRQGRLAVCLFGHLLVHNARRRTLFSCRHPHPIKTTAASASGTRDRIQLPCSISPRSPHLPTYTLSH